jgi:signal transduction histidine kinase
MKNSTRTRAEPSFPRRWVLAVALLVSLGLLVNAVYTYITLTRLRSQYLDNRGYEIAAALDAQARGAGRRNNPEYWQSLLDTHYEVYSGSAAFLAVVGPEGRILASAGDAGAIADPGPDLFLFEDALGHPRRGRREASPGMNDWKMRIGLYTSSADFIRRLALLQLAISAMAVLIILGLTFFLLRTLDRFLKLKAREGEEAQLRALGVMSASLAHEIRNPLGAMKGLTQLAQEDLEPGHPAQERLRTVVAEAERLERLVSDLLDFARPREPEIREFDLVPLLGDLRVLLQPKLAAAGITLDLPTASNPITLRSDPAGMRQVLLNVLLNALEASPPGGAIGVTLARAGGFLEIRVDDAGSGFGGRDPEELMRPFVTGKTRGTGLGLAVSRQIMERLGGALTLGPNPGGGARCTLRLPDPGLRP